MTRWGILVIGLAVGLQSCGAASQGQRVSRAELAGIVRPAGERPAGVARLQVRDEQGVERIVEIDRGQFWDQTGVILAGEATK